MSLKKQALSGMIWTFAQQFGTQVIGFGLSTFLARLLMPSDFGTIALFGILIEISGVLINSGLTSSLIRTQDITITDYSTVFIFNLVISVFLYLALFALAPVFSTFYKLPILIPLVRLYGLTLIINALTAVQQTQFTKNMDFKIQLKVTIPSLIVSGLSGLALAYYGFGVWALVYMAVIQSVMQCAQFWFYSKWRPQWIFDRSRFKYHFLFGYKMAFSGLLSTIFNNAYVIIIGKFFSATELGFYNRADTLKQLPVSNLSNALNKVTYPLFAKIQDDDQQLRAVYKKLMKTVIFIIAPVLMCMVLLAKPLVHFLLTDKWLVVAPYLQILSIAGLLYPIHAYNLNILEVKGKSDLYLRLEIIKKVIIMIVISITFKFGIVGLLWGQVAISVLAFFINTHYSGQLLKYNSLQQIADIAPTILLTVLLGGIFWYIDSQYLVSMLTIARLLLVSSLYIITYVFLAKLLRFTEFDFIKNTVLNK